MKKILIVLSLLMFPFISHGFYAGFSDGNFFNSDTGKFSFMCFTDNNCYDIDSKFMGTKDQLLQMAPVDNSYYETLPVIDQPIMPKVLVAGNSLLPAFSEAELPHLTMSEFGQSYKVLPCGVHPKSDSAFFYCGGTYKDYIGYQIQFNNKVIVDENKTEITITDLTPDTTYSYQIIYNEAGRTSTVLDKTFTTNK